MNVIEATESVREDLRALARRGQDIVYPFIKMHETPRLAVVGSRGAHYEMRFLVEAIVGGLPKRTTVVSGGAGGVDRWAEDAARRAGLPVLSIPANWALHGRSAGMMRNATIVDECNELIAFWDGASRGTANSISRAVDAGKWRATFVMRNNGRMEVHAMR